MEFVKPGEIKVTPKTVEELSTTLKCSYCKDELSNSFDAEICVRTDESNEILHLECAEMWGIPKRKLGISYAQYLRFNKYSVELAALCEGKPELYAELSETFKIPQHKTTVVIGNPQNLETVLTKEFPVEDNFPLENIKTNNSRPIVWSYQLGIPAFFGAATVGYAANGYLGMIIGIMISLFVTAPIVINELSSNSNK